MREGESEGGREEEREESVEGRRNGRTFSATRILVNVYLALVCRGVM